MSGEAVRNNIDALGELGNALERFAAESQRSVAEAGREAVEVLDRINAEIGRRQMAVSDLEQALAACRRNEKANCSGIERELAHAREKLEAAFQARAGAQTAVSRFAPRSQRFARECGRLAVEGQAQLGQRKQELAQYLGSTAAAGAAVGQGPGSTSAGDSAGNSANGGRQGAHGLPEGFAMVDVSDIDTSDRSISRQDFGKGYSPEDLAWGFNALHEVVLPAMAAGHGRDYFAARDLAEGRSGTRSYSDTYSGFFGRGDAIKFERGANGQIGLGNGYHRVWVARQAGIQQVPGWFK